MKILKLPFGIIEILKNGDPIEFSGAKIKDQYVKNSTVKESLMLNFNYDNCKKNDVIELKIYSALPFRYKGSQNKDNIKGKSYALNDYVVGLSLAVDSKHVPKDYSIYCDSTYPSIIYYFAERVKESKVDKLGFALVYGIGRLNNKVSKDIDSTSEDIIKYIQK
ncbi:hypothetical protein M5C72_10265 [Companilactobacillus allii]|uniref:Uncharacterized protein n=1 Tax=Companilactobacillus allii TaxID=1847728 RepID=A0A1P8PZW8_9LACO|nr:hypothetical protein [Companilactobacillus allii]APX71145.1 hypothetical protein BTM29_00635 [Companilactobacillus allii]USQ68226.1 hypothetical protein M5C72_10265 [Companilactobacillus allii]